MRVNLLHRRVILISLTTQNNAFLRAVQIQLAAVTDKKTRGLQFSR